MLETIKKIINLSQKRINYLHNVNNRWFYKWYKTYIEAIQEELKEAKDEIKKHNDVYLEDELWDVFWCYLCLIHSLEEEKLIDKEKIFERCFKKFSERIWEWWDDWSNWYEVKEKQKKELAEEHELINNEKWIKNN